jgi:hypothetical protein
VRGIEQRWSPAHLTGGWRRRLALCDICNGRQEPPACSASRSCSPFWTVKGATPSSSDAELALYSVTTLTALIWIVIETAQRRHIQRAELELIRVDIVPGFGDDRFPLLDITVCNRGGATAVLHELLIEDTKVWVFARRGGPSARPVSWTYDIDIGADPPQRWRIFSVRGAQRFGPLPGTARPLALATTRQRVVHLHVPRFAHPRQRRACGRDRHLCCRGASVISDAAVVQPQVIGLFAAVRDEIDKYKVRRSAQ